MKHIQIMIIARLTEDMSQRNVDLGLTDTLMELIEALPAFGPGSIIAAVITDIDAIIAPAPTTTCVLTCLHNLVVGACPDCTEPS